MGDWADENASAIFYKCNLISYSEDDLVTVAFALRQTRNDALEEVALLFEQFPTDYWSSKRAAFDVRSLKDK